MKYSKKELVFSCHTESEKLELVKQLTEKIKFVDMTISSSLMRVKVTLYGPRDRIKFAVEEAKAIFKRIRQSMYPGANGLYTYDLGIVTEKCGRSTSIEDLERLLKLKGYKVKVINDEQIKTNASLNELTSLVLKFWNAYEEGFYVQPKSIRKLIAAISAALDMQFENVLKVAFEKELLKKVQNGRYGITMPLERVIVEIVKSIKGAINESKGVGED
ncbi:MAG: DUF2067 family protein [Candidatus Baldrarchaeia archaeon]